MTDSFIADGYENAVTKMGTARDPKSHTVFKMPRILGPDELWSMYEGNGLARRIVDRMADDATREGFEIEGPDKAFDWAGLSSEIEDLEVCGKLAEAIRWERLYGGSVVMLAASDNLKLDQPLDLLRCRKLNALQVIEAPMALPVAFNAGLGSRGFGEPTSYDVQVPWSTGGVRRVHRTRVLRFTAGTMPVSKRFQSNGWPGGVLQRCIDELQRYGSAHDYAEGILHVLNILVLRMQNLRVKKAGSEVDIDKVADKFAATLTQYGIALVDKEDEMSTLSRDVSGLDRFMGRFVDALVAVTDMPREILLGITQGGLNTGANEGPFRAWYDHCAAYQRKVLTPAVNRILECIFAARRLYGVAVPDKWTIRWRPLWQPTEKEQAETDLLKAQARVLYLTNSVFAADELRPKIAEEMGIELLPEPEPLPEGDPMVADDPAELQQSPSAPPAGEQLLSGQELGQQLGVSAASIRSMHRRGEIPGWQIGGRWRYAASTVHSASHRPAQEPPSAAPAPA